MATAAIVLIFFSFVALMVKWSLDQKRNKMPAEGVGSSLGTGELRSLIQEAMLDAIAPLEERLNVIEMNTRRLPENDAEGKQVEATLPNEPSYEVGFCCQKADLSSSAEFFQNQK